jgi:uncharacterized OsmC-like protein
MSTTEMQTVNGVDVGRLLETIGAVTEDHTLATFQFRARNRWIDGGQNRSTIEGFYGAGGEDQTRTAAFTYDNDEPDVLLGTDHSANPVEFVLHALAGCLTTTLVYHAAARGIEVRRVESSLLGDLDLRGFLGMSDEIRRGYSAIRVAFDIDAPGSTEEQREELITMAQSFSPVFDIVTNGVPVSVDLKR